MITTDSPDIDNDNRDADNLPLDMFVTQEERKHPRYPHYPHSPNPCNQI